jgi:hypothetical protein
VPVEHLLVAAATGHAVLLVAHHAATLPLTELPVSNLLKQISVEKVVQGVESSSHFCELSGPL